MPNTVTLKRGLDIPLKGRADCLVAPIEPSPLYALKPTDFPHISPQLLVKEGDVVFAGSPLFCNKSYPKMMFTSSLSGTVQAIVRGEKRKIQEIRIAPDWEDKAVIFPVALPEDLSAQQIIDILLQSGCWPYLSQRPYGIVANPEDVPVAIYMSCFDSAPLAPDYDFAYAQKLQSLQMGIRVLERLCPGKVHLGLNAESSEHSVFRQLKGIVHFFRGPHPAGNPGVQLHHVCPVSKETVIWTIDPCGLSVIGSLFLDGTYNSLKPVAITGSGSINSRYIWCHSGIGFQALKDYMAPREEGLRYISGNPLTGDNVGADGYLGFYHQQVTFLPEGDRKELFGWARPLRLKKFSAARTYLTYLAPLLAPHHTFDLTTNTNGETRAFVVTDAYRKVLPMDILLPFLLKAVLAKDIDKMEMLGIYEVIPEDIALCEFICASKIDLQAILQDGIDLMIKEMQL